MEIMSDKRPFLYRAYSAKSGSTFNKKQGFVARGSDIPFGLDDSEAAGMIVIDHLDWDNVSIPSPLISVSSEESVKKKAKEVGNRSRAQVFIAKIVLDRDSDSVKWFHMCSLWKNLHHRKVPQRWRDKDEYVFVHRIPISCIVEVFKIVNWTRKGYAACLDSQPVYWRNHKLIRPDPPRSYSPQSEEYENHEILELEKQLQVIIQRIWDTLHIVEETKELCRRSQRREHTTVVQQRLRLD